MLSSRGFSLASGLLVVAAVLTTLMLPLPVTRANRLLGDLEFGATRDAARMACMQLAPLGLIRLARQRMACAHHLPAAGRLVAGPVNMHPVADAWRVLAPGIDYRRVRVSADVDLHEVRLDLHRADLRLLRASALGRRNASVVEMARKAGAVAATNASYFGPDNQPLGYLKVSGKVVVPWTATGAAFTGVFMLEGRQARIVARDRFRASESDTALQAGPRLVADGRPTAGLLETRSFRQTGIAVTRSGRVVLYATDGSYRGLTWQETRGILLGPSAEGGIEPADVLNLDGGSSSQLFARTSNVHPVVTGMYTPVPVAVGFFARGR